MIRKKQTIDNNKNPAVKDVLLFATFISVFLCFIAYMIGRTHGEKSGVQKFKASEHYLSLYNDHTADRYADQIEITENEISTLNGKLIWLKKKHHEAQQ